VPLLRRIRQWFFRDLVREPKPPSNPLRPVVMVEGPSISLEEVKKRRFLDIQKWEQLQAERRRLLSVLQQRQAVNSPTAWERLLKD
jgi:hypothetical protein